MTVLSDLELNDVEKEVATGITTTNGERHRCVIVIATVRSCGSSQTGPFIEIGIRNTKIKV